MADTNRVQAVEAGMAAVRQICSALEGWAAQAGKPKMRQPEPDSPEPAEAAVQDEALLHQLQGIYERGLSAHPAWPGSPAALEACVSRPAQHQGRQTGRGRADTVKPARRIGWAALDVQGHCRPAACDHQAGCRCTALGMAGPSLAPSCGLIVSLLRREIIGDLAVPTAVRACVRASRCSGVLPGAHLQLDCNDLAASTGAMSSAIKLCLSTHWGGGSWDRLAGKIGGSEAMAACQVQACSSAASCEGSLCLAEERAQHWHAPLAGLPSHGHFLLRRQRRPSQLAALEHASARQAAAAFATTWPC